MFAPPGYLTQKFQGYERHRQRTIRDNLLEMKEAGIENPSKFIFGSNQSGKANGTDKRKKKIGRGHGDEDYVPCNGEERMSDSDNDGSSSSQVNKVKRVDLGKKKGGSAAQLSRKSQRNEEGGSTSQGATRAHMQNLSQLHEENNQLKSQMAHMQNSIDELKKNQVHHPPTTFQTTPVVSPSSINTHSNSNKCKLLDWMGTGEVVVEGYWSSNDPKALVHHIPIGPNAMRVWVDVAKKSDFFLWRTTSDMEYVKDAVGTTVAWPADKILMDSTPRSSIG